MLENVLIRKLGSNEKLYTRYKQAVSTFLSIYFGSPITCNNNKKNSINVQTVDPDVAQFLFLEKGLGLVSPPHIVHENS